MLILDGHDETRALYSLALSAMGFDVVPAKDGAEDYTRAWETDPDIIVTEFPMPTCDGSGFVQLLKQSPRTCDIPVVALGGDTERSRHVSESSGLAASFSRSCPPHELAAGLRLVLDGKNQVR